MEHSYLKYKNKYMRLKQLGGNGVLTARDKINYIELYDKTLSLYFLYRIRYDNTKDMISDVNDSNNKIHTLKNELKDAYNTYYIKNLLSLSKSEIDILLRDNRDGVIFTLRRMTNSLIHNLYLIGPESISNVEKFLTFFAENNLNDPEFSEINNKCVQLKNLVTPSITPFTEIDESTLTDDNKVRYYTNKITNIIGNTNSQTLINYSTHKPNNIDEQLNNILDGLFRKSFKIILDVLNTA